MVYSNNLVAVIKNNGNIIREDGNIVRLPFGCEYSILVKNLSPQDSLISIKIDGTDVFSGNKIILRKNSEHEIIGFMNENGVIKNKFKFIHKTDEISDYRGDRIDDGFINIEYQFAKDYRIRDFTPYTYTCAQPMWISGDTWCGSVLDSPSISNTTTVYTSNSKSINRNISQDEGITVKGSQTEKNYENGWIGDLFPEKYNLIIRLKGTNNKEYVTPIYNNTKLVCSTCGRKSKSNMKYCPNCGTSLI